MIQLYLEKRLTLTYNIKVIENNSISDRDLFLGYLIDVLNYYWLINNFQSSYKTTYDIWHRVVGYSKIKTIESFQYKLLRKIEEMPPITFLI